MFIIYNNFKFHDSFVFEILKLEYMCVYDNLPSFVL